MNKQTLNKGDKKNRTKTIINIMTVMGICGLICIVCVLLFIGTQNIYFSYIGNSENAGQIGDSAGLLNSLFSGLAFLGVIVTVFLQGKELKYTREELIGQKEQFKIQNKTLKRQQFENTFFNMLKTQENIISNLRVQVLQPTKSREVFKELYYGLDIRLKNTLNEQKPFTEESIISVYNDEQKIQMLDHYFRHMYRIVKFVNKTDFSFCLDDKEDKNKTDEEKKKKIKNEKYQYTSILRATLSPYELVLLFYNCLNKENKFRPLIEEYSLLQNIRSGFLRKDIFGFYENKAYGNKYEAIKKELENRA